MGDMEHISSGGGVGGLPQEPLKAKGEKGTKKEEITQKMAFSILGNKPNTTPTHQTPKKEMPSPPEKSMVQQRIKMYEEMTHGAKKAADAPAQVTPQAHFHERPSSPQIGPSSRPPAKAPPPIPKRESSIPPKVSSPRPSRTTDAPPPVPPRKDSPSPGRVLPPVPQRTSTPPSKPPPPIPERKVPTLGVSLPNVPAQKPVWVSGVKGQGPSASSVVLGGDKKKEMPQPAEEKKLSVPPNVGGSEGMPSAGIQAPPAPLLGASGGPKPKQGGSFLSEIVSRGGEKTSEEQAAHAAACKTIVDTILGDKLKGTSLLDVLRAMDKKERGVPVGRIQDEEGKESFAKLENMIPTAIFSSGPAKKIQFSKIADQFSPLFDSSGNFKTQQDKLQELTLLLSELLTLSASENSDDTVETYFMEARDIVLEKADRDAQELLRRKEQERAASSSGPNETSLGVPSAPKPPLRKTPAAPPKMPLETKEENVPPTDVPAKEESNFSKLMERQIAARKEELAQREARMEEEEEESVDEEEQEW